MEIKYKFVLYIGAAVIVLMTALAFCIRSKPGSYTGGKKIADMIYLKDGEYLNRRKKLYKMYSCIAAGMSMLAVAAGFFMISRPYMVERVKDEKYCRDIILCIDISTSVDYLNENLLEKLKSTVDELDGERFGIVIFNTSPVMLTPLTDDYEYVKEQLQLIEDSLKSRNSLDLFSYDDDWMYYYEYISAGTLVGNEERGSSLIGDGLAAAAYDFSDDEDRPRVIIFSTDNDIQGSPIVTLDEAADICADNEVTVYGIGTKEMTVEAQAGMKTAVEKTGGRFFMEEDEDSFSEIVTSIEKLSAGLVQTSGETRDEAKLKLPFAVLLIAFAGILVSAKALKL